MNILYLTQVESLDFGAGNQVKSMALGFARLNHNVIVISKNKKTPSEAIENAGNENLSIKELGGRGSLYFFLYPFQVFLYGVKYIITSNIEVIYERLGLIPLGFWLSKLFKKPLIIAAQDLAYWDSRHDIESVSQMANDKLFARKKIYNQLLTSKFVMAILRKLASINYKNATWIITVTPQVKHVISTLYKINPEKIIVLYNGADADLFSPLETKSAKKMLKLDEATQYICYVGTLTYYEGVEDLVKSAPLVLEKYPDIRFLIVGDGPSKNELVSLTKQEGVINKFIFIGAVKHDDVPKYINASEICVCPVLNDTKSKTAGSSGLKSFEYMACGKPVVMSDTDGNKDLIAETNAGLIARTERPHEFASAIIKLLEDKKLSQNLGENGRKAVVEKYSWSSIAKKVSESFDEAIKSHK